MQILPCFFPCLLDFSWAGIKELEAEILIGVSARVKYFFRGWGMVIFCWGVGDTLFQFQLELQVGSAKLLPQLPQNPLWYQAAFG